MNIESFLQAMLGAGANLMAISVTLVALIPVFIEIARTKSPDFFTEAEAQRKLKMGLRLLGLTIWMFGGCASISLIDLFFLNCWLLVAAAILLLLGLIILSIVSYMLTNLALAFS